MRLLILLTMVFQTFPRLSVGLRSPTARKIIFLGTPSVAARSLELLYKASLQTEAWKVEAVITQPAQMAGTCVCVCVWERESLVNSTYTAELRIFFHFFPRFRTW
jgi:hypothetical protein